MADVTEETRKKLWQRFIFLSKQNPPVKFIEQRHYDQLVIKKLGLGLCTLEVYEVLLQEFGRDTLKQAGFFSGKLYKYLNRVVIPFNDTYCSMRSLNRDTENKNLFPAGIPKQPYIILGSTNVCYVVEGETDAIALHHIYPNDTIFALGGTTSYKLLKKITGLEPHLETVIIAYDKDGAGRDCTQKTHSFLKKMFSGLAQKQLIWPEEFKDVDEVYFNKRQDSFSVEDVLVRDVRIKSESYYSYPPDETRPRITLPGKGRLVSDAASEIQEQIKGKNELFFRFRENCVQKLERLPIKDVKKRDVLILGFRDLSPSEMITYIEKYILPGINVWDDSSKSWTFLEKSMNAETAKTILSSERFKEGLPLIDGILVVPLPRLVDGKLTFPKRGYDEDFQSWLPYDAPDINPNISLSEALLTLNTVYGEFCFEKPQDKINAIAGLLTPFLRGLYSRSTCRTPVFFYKANRERAGKDYCAEITGIVMYGVAHSDPPISDGKETHDEEFRKKILGLFREGRMRLHSSNNKGFLNSAQLESLATSESFADRKLGTNTTLTYPNKIELSLSANTGITYTPDLANRCVFICLFLEMENPNERKFKNPDLHGWVREHRHEILSALYALVRNWHEKGMPPGSLPFSSFPEWAKICGGILEAAGLGNPCVPNDINANIGGDVETQDMKRLFEICYERYKDMWVNKKPIMDSLENQADEEFCELFRWLDWNKTGQKNARMAFGRMLNKYVGRVLSDIRLEMKDAANISRREYKFVNLSTMSTSSTSSTQKNKKLDEYGEGVDDNPSSVGEIAEPSAKSGHSRQCRQPALPHEILLNALTAHPSGIQESELQLELAGLMDFDTFCDTVDQLKSKGDIMESPKGTLRWV